MTSHACWPSTAEGPERLSSRPIFSLCRDMAGAAAGSGAGVKPIVSTIELILLFCVWPVVHSGRVIHVLSRPTSSYTRTDHPIP